MCIMLAVCVCVYTVQSTEGLKGAGNLELELQPRFLIFTRNI